MDPTKLHLTRMPMHICIYYYNTTDYDINNNIYNAVPP